MYYNNEGGLSWKTTFTRRWPLKISLTESMPVGLKITARLGAFGSTRPAKILEEKWKKHLTASANSDTIIV